MDSIAIWYCSTINTAVVVVLYQRTVLYSRTTGTVQLYAVLVLVLCTLYCTRVVVLYCSLYSTGSTVLVCRKSCTDHTVLESSTVLGNRSTVRVTEVSTQQCSIGILCKNGCYWITAAQWITATG